MSSRQGRSLRLVGLPARFAIVRLGPDVEIPGWATIGSFVSITRTQEELSIIVEERFVPNSCDAQRGWHCWRIAGTFNLETETGVIASVASPIADAGLSLFVVSTFDTDYVLVKQERRDEIAEVLRNAGHQVEDSAPA